MKVYIIEKGAYSDRHVVGVTEAEEKAKKICEIIDADYSEWDTNQFSTDRIRFVVDYWCGNWTAEYDEYNLYSMYSDNVCDYENHYVIYANSIQQAIKIAQDMAAKIKAEKEGTV